MGKVNITITTNTPIKVILKPSARYASAVQREEQEFTKQITKHLKEAKGNAINKKISALNAEK